MNGAAEEVEAAEGHTDVHLLDKAASAAEGLDAVCLLYRVAELLSATSCTGQQR
jgi:hypothetical protein